MGRTPWYEVKSIVLRPVSVKHKIFCCYPMCAYGHWRWASDGWADCTARQNRPPNWKGVLLSFVFWGVYSPGIQSFPIIINQPQKKRTVEISLFRSFCGEQWELGVGQLWSAALLLKLCALSWCESLFHFKRPCSITLVVSGVFVPLCKTGLQVVLEIVDCFHWETLFEYGLHCIRVLKTVKSWVVWCSCSGLAGRNNSTMMVSQPGPKGLLPWLLQFCWSVLLWLKFQEVNQTCHESSLVFFEKSSDITGTA